MLRAARNFGHGYLALTDGRDRAIYQVSDAPTSPGAEGGLRWDDPALDARVAASRPTVVSDKDANVAAAGRERRLPVGLRPLMLITRHRAAAARAAEGRPIRVGLVGAGFMGRGLANQIVNSVPGHGLLVADGEQAPSPPPCAPTPRPGCHAGRACRTDRGGRRRDDREGRPLPCSSDAFALLAGRSRSTCMVDVTGAVEFGARVTVAAIERGLPVVTMNAELDGTVGPLLAHRARAAGVVLTGADGDQPGVQGNLLRFVREPRA
jgi:hypothetical protein